MTSPTQTESGPLIAELLPPEVACAETREPGELSQLLAPEAGLIDRWAPRRVAEFAAGRACARRALSAIGHGDWPLLRGEDREPLWPTGVVGSITHTDGYCAAVAARAQQIATVGIDAEAHDHLPDGILGRISLPDEAAWVAARAGDGTHWDRVLFSAKETVFKAWFPLTRRWLEFEGARIELSPAPRAPGEAQRGTFQATLLVEPPAVDGQPLEVLPGRFLITPELILAAITIPRGA
ncbi:MAG TPA: 4'-phosphopantetheinyl transferase superfamily protein [Solirubrobacteraceae bacterium]|nr:4'-phosphopantetheinyl transferase superfamily protein [Solirubrobacteraceae bacterium]